MVCKNCGCENPNESICCEVCGTKLDKIDDNIPNQNNEKSRADKSKITIISLATAIIVLIIVIVAIIISLNKNDINTYEDDTTHTSTHISTESNENENTFESKSIIDEGVKNTTNVTTIQSTTEATTLSEKEINRKKALDYIDKANDALKNGEREGALQMADAALDVCDDDDIKQKYDKIYEYAPFELYRKNNILKEDPKPYIGYKIKDVGSDNANDGSTLPNCFTIMHNEEADGCLSEITYNLSGKYDVVTGTGYIPSYSKNADQNGYFVIHGDGKKLYTSSIFNSGVLPEKFEINVSGVDRLVLSFYAKPYNGGGLGGDNYFTHFGISDFKAIKNLP